MENTQPETQFHEANTLHGMLVIDNYARNNGKAFRTTFGKLTDSLRGELKNELQRLLSAYEFGIFVPACREVSPMALMPGYFGALLFVVYLHLEKGSPLSQINDEMMHTAMTQEESGVPLTSWVM